MLCCMNRQKGTQKVLPKRLATQQQTRKFDMRNKFFCLVCGGKTCKNEN